MLYCTFSKIFKAFSYDTVHSSTATRRKEKEIIVLAPRS